MQFAKKKLHSPGTRLKHGAKRKQNILQEYEEQIKAINKNGVNQYNIGCDISHPNIERGSTSRQYQIQRLKRDAPDIAKRLLRLRPNPP